LCEKTKSKYMFRGYTKKVIFGVTVIFGVFCVSTNQICLSNIFDKQKTRCKILYRPTLTTPILNTV